MASGVITVGRQQYAVGLYWENSPGSGRVAQIAREAALQPGQQAEFFAVRAGNKNGRIPQFGLSAASVTGQKQGMPVLAGCLASQIPGSWAGAFRFNEGFAVVIVRDDLIVPDGDLYFLDEGEARDRLIQEIGFGGLQTIYAPESWSIPGADTVPVSLLLNDRADIKLQLVRIPKEVKMIAAAALGGFLVLVAGVWYWQSMSDDDEKMRTQAQLTAVVPSVLQQPAPPPPPKYDRKWETSPDPMDLITACIDGLAKAPVTSAGWHITGISCTGTSLGVSWTRDKGAGLPPPDAVLSPSGVSASESIALIAPPARGPQSLADPDEITKRYLVQNWPGNLSEAVSDPPPPPPPGYTGPWNPPPAPWVKRSFTFTVPELPGDTQHMFAGLPGVVIEKLESSPGSSPLGGTWNVGGVIYENRK